MKIGVSGAGGHIEHAVIQELLARGTEHSVIGISSSPPGVQAPAVGRRADYNEPATLLRAFEGLKRILLVPSTDAGPGLQGWEMSEAIDAARRAGVSHIVMLSVAGLRDEHEAALDAAFWIAEQHLIRTAPCWTIIRMNFLIESIVWDMQMALSSGSLMGLGEERVAFVSLGDVAAAAASVLLGEGHTGAIYHATGPITLSGEERAAMLAQLPGTPIGFEQLTEAQLRNGLVEAGWPDHDVDRLLAIKRKFVQGQFDIVTGDVKRLTGRRPVALHEMWPRLFNVRSGAHARP